MVAVFMRGQDVLDLHRIKAGVLDPRPVLLDRQAGIRVDGAEDMISEDAKHELLTHLRRSHGRDDAQANAAPRKITLRRKSQSELKLASPQGRARTVNVEVRSKRTYVKREHGLVPDGIKN